jgi:hypothetical protein
MKIIGQNSGLHNLNKIYKALGLKSVSELFEYVEDKKRPQEEKLKAVQDYLGGKESYQSIGDRIGISKSSVIN